MILCTISALNEYLRGDPLLILFRPIEGLFPTGLFPIIGLGGALGVFKYLGLWVNFGLLIVLGLRRRDDPASALSG